jgi:zeaxanthin glucosyltransferase
MAVLGAQAAAEGDLVVVATAPEFRERALGDGFSWTELTLSRGHNTGASRPEHQRGAEARHLREFFAATRRGAVDTLVFQADRRVDDLLWEPERVAERVADIIAKVRPDRIIADQVSLTSTAALVGLGVPFETFVPGHPSQLPIGDEVYGCPPAWPSALDPGEEGRERVRDACERVTELIAERFDAAASAIAGRPMACGDPFRLHGENVLFNYRRDLHDAAREASLTFPHTFLNGCVRTESLPTDLGGWVDGLDGRPFVYVSLGTFFSERDDVLATIAEALRHANLPAAIAVGSLPLERLGPIPATWCVEPILPQVALLEKATVAITHGGGNSVVEALSSGTPMIALPFSTDQFAIGADLERTGRARCLNPNTLDSGDVCAALENLIGDGGGTAATPLAQPVST